MGIAVRAAGGRARDREAGKTTANYAETRRDVEVHNGEIVDDFRLALGVTSHSGAANEQGVRVALRYVKG